MAGLDRGLASTRLQQDEVEALTRQLERTWHATDLQAGAVPPSISLLDSMIGPCPVLQADPAPLAGKWRLVYSSAFGTGSLGGRYPGPPKAGLPFTLGQVFQRIQTGKGSLANIVELLLPQLPLLGQASVRCPLLMPSVLESLRSQGGGE